MKEKNAQDLETLYTTKGCPSSQYTFAKILKGIGHYRNANQNLGKMP
jgi:hypothetical protein